MDPIHPVSFQSAIKPFLNHAERQPGREQDSFANTPQSQRLSISRSVQNAVLHVGVPERSTDTGQTGSNLQTQPAGNGGDSLTTLNSNPILFNSTQQPIAQMELAQQFQQYYSIDNIMSQLQTTAKDVQTGVELTGMASIEIHELIQLIKQISKDTDAIDQIMQYIEGQSSGQNVGNSESSGISIGKGLALAISKAQQAQVEIVQQESIEITRQIEFTLTTRINENGDETPDRVLRVDFNGEKIVNTEVITVGQSDPLVLDLDDDGIELSGVDDGVLFDINADGIKEQTAFVAGSDAFLALDRNFNGIIDDGGELFGDQHGAKDGFEELRRFDFNDDGLINDRDPLFTKLLLYNDQNRDGYSQLDEIHTLKQKRIEAILLDSAEDVEYQINGNPIIKAGSYVLKDGSHHRLADALLNYSI